MKAVVAAFNQEKALVGAFFVIVKTGCGTDGSICGTSVHRIEYLLCHINSAGERYAISEMIVQKEIESI